MRMMMRRTTDGGRPGLLVEARPTKASSIAGRQHSGGGTKIEYTHALQGTRREGGNSKTGEHRFFSSPSSLLEGEQRQNAVLEEGTSMRMRINQTIMEHIFGNYNIKATM